MTTATPFPFESSPGSHGHAGHGHADHGHPEHGHADHSRPDHSRPADGLALLGGDAIHSPDSMNGDANTYESATPNSNEPLSLFAFVEPDGLLSFGPIYDEDGGLPVGFQAAPSAPVDHEDMALLLRMELDRLLTRILIAGVERTQAACGQPPTRTEVSAYLRRIASVDRDRLADPLRGLLVRIPATEVRGALDHLMSVGLLRFAEVGSRRLVLTPEGSEYLQCFGADSGVVGVLRRLLGCEPETALNHDLKAFRRERARQLHKPAFRVLTNRAIDAIATRRPKTLGELARLPSIGPITLADHGPNLLAIVRRHEQGAAV